MFERRNNILTGTETPEFGNLFRVVVYQRGGYASANGPGLTIPLKSGHSFQLGDKALLDPGGLNVVTSAVVGVGATSITFAESYTFGSGMRVANVGPDTAGAGVLNWQASRMFIHPVGDDLTRIANATVYCDTQGNYAYDYKGDGQAWELVIGVDSTCAGVVDGFSSTGGDRINVWDYGTGEGLATDGPAIRAAISGLPTGGELVIPGVYDYILDASIVFNRGDFTVTFEPGARFVVDPGNGLSARCISVTSGTGLRLANIRINNFVGYDPDPANHVAAEASRGIVMIDCDDIIINGCSVEDTGGTGVNLQGCTNFDVRNVKLDGCCAESGASGGVSLRNCFNGTVHNVHIVKQANGSGIHLAQAIDQDVGSIAIYGVRIDELANDKPGEAFGVGVNFNVTAGRLRSLVLSDVIINAPPKQGVQFITPAFSPAADEGIQDFQIEGVIVNGGGDDAPDGSPTGAVLVDSGCSIGVITGCLINSWGVHATNHYGIAVAGKRIAINGNTVENYTAAIKNIYTTGNVLVTDANVVAGNVPPLENSVGVGDYIVIPSKVI